MFTYLSFIKVQTFRSRASISVQESHRFGHGVDFFVWDFRAVLKFGFISVTQKE
jgi:hypothetical protein